MKNCIDTSTQQRLLSEAELLKNLSAENSHTELLAIPLDSELITDHAYPINNNQHRHTLTYFSQLSQKQTQRLLRTTTRLSALPIDLAWIENLEDNEGHNELFDVFVSRYGRLQDTLGNKLLPALLTANLEKTGSQLDNLLLAEKLGWIDSMDAWVDLRDLRNQLIHEYMESPQGLLDALQAALKGAEVLAATQTRLTDHAQQKGFIAQLP